MLFSKTGFSVRHYFKKINDSFGHDVGNEVLIHFAKTVCGLLDKKDAFGRIGGEEWLIVKAQTKNKDEIKQWMQKLHKAYAQHDISNLGKDYNLTFSAGILICSSRKAKLDDLLINVDKTMYQAKTDGRNRDNFYTL